MIIQYEYIRFGKVYKGEYNYPDDKIIKEIEKKEMVQVKLI